MGIVLSILINLCLGPVIFVLLVLTCQQRPQQAVPIAVTVWQPAIDSMRFGYYWIER